MNLAYLEVDEYLHSFSPPSNGRELDDRFSFEFFRLAMVAPRHVEEANKKKKEFVKVVVSYRASRDKEGKRDKRVSFRLS